VVQTVSILFVQWEYPDIFNKRSKIYSAFHVACSKWPLNVFRHVSQTHCVAICFSHWMASPTVKFYSCAISINYYLWDSIVLFFRSSVTSFTA